MQFYTFFLKMESKLYVSINQYKQGVSITSVKECWTGIGSLSLVLAWQFV